MPKLKLTCFNTFQAFLEERPISTFQRAKAQAPLDLPRDRAKSISLAHHPIGATLAGLPREKRAA